MKVSKILISNILGIDEMEITPGSVTKISGRNGVGKTSVLEAIKAALKGGHQAELLRKGEEKAEVILILDNGMRIVKTVTADDSTLKLTHPEFGKVSKPMDFMKQLADALAINPIQFLEAKPDARADFLLEAMPLEVDPAEIAKIVPSDFILDIKGHALKVIDKISKLIFDRRQDINRNAKEKRSTIEQLSVNVPESAEDFSKTLNEKQDEWSKQEASKHNELSSIDAQLSIDIENLRKWAEDYRTRIRAKYEADASKLSQEVGELRQKVETEIKNRNTRNIINDMMNETAKLENRSKILTEAIDNLDGYKLGLLKNLPIRGIEIKDGKVFRDGIEYDRLNTAQQIEIAVDLAKLRAKELKLVVVDGIEMLDKERFEIMEKLFTDSDYQLVCATVTDDKEMKVETK